MSEPSAVIIIELWKNKMPQVKLMRIDPMQAAQACATAAAQIILGQREKSGQAPSGGLIEVPSMIL